MLGGVVQGYGWTPPAADTEGERHGPELTLSHSHSQAMRRQRFVVRSRVVGYSLQFVGQLVFS